MILWTKSEFDHVASTTRLSDRTLDACRDVLVHGLSGVDAAEKNNILPAQISRGVSTLRERYIEYVAALEKQQKAKDTLRAAVKSSVIKYARDLAGEKLVVRDAAMGSEYEGEVLVKEEGFLVQKTGRSAVIHDLGNLVRVPNVGSYIVIAYPEKEGMGKVRITDETSLAQGGRARAADTGKTKAER